VPITVHNHITVWTAWYFAEAQRQTSVRWTHIADPNGQPITRWRETHRGRERGWWSGERSKLSSSAGSDRSPGSWSPR